ncbi:MAG: pyridoxal phosphate-dependent aminotransferase [Anaerolineae bacterium]|nr:pyridoxal phosphate-dependent aminotransferase [Anaerolineae bacterium]
MNKLTISQRGVHMPASAMRKLAPFADEAKACGIDVIHLNIGQPDIETPPEFWEAVSKFPEQTLAYGPSAGRSECIDGMVEYYARFDIPLTANQIIITTAGSEALLFALMACGDAGDEVIIPEPFYSNYAGLATMAGLHVVPFTTFAQDDYRLPPREAIERLVGERTRVILYSSPGNPTGVVYTPEEVAMLGDIARTHRLYLLSDEPYRELSYDGQIATSALHLPGMEEHVIVLDSISKRFSACGARIGCVVSRNAALMETIMKLAMARLSAPVLEQIGAAACLVNTPTSYFEEMREEYTRRRDIVYERLNQIEGVYCPKPAGAFYAMAKIEGVDTEDFARWLLTDFQHAGQTVMVAPGSGFYTTPGLGHEEIRIAYVLETEVLSRAMDLLTMAIRRYRSEPANQ